MASCSFSVREGDIRSGLENAEVTQRPPAAVSHESPATHHSRQARGSFLPSNEAQLCHGHRENSERRGFDQGRESNLPSDLLMNISSSIHNRKESIHLAIKLNIDEDKVLRMLDQAFTAEMPFGVLDEWVDKWRHKATGALLYRVLHEIDRPDIADHFAQELLKQDIDLAVEMERTTPEPLPEENGAIHISQMRPSMNVLQEVALFLPKLKHWVRLARNLELGVDFVEQVKAGRFASDVVALKILCKWREEKRAAATSKALFDALVATSRDVAACFVEKLLGEEDEDWEEVCYDNSHRDFFRVLKRHHIDIVAAYESMRCTEKFLSRLQSQQVLSALEFEDLLASSQVLPRLKMNKKLLDLVNGKDKQPQEVFCDVLTLCQRHLLVLDDGEGTSQQSQTYVPLYFSFCLS